MNETELKNMGLIVGNSSNLGDVKLGQYSPLSKDVKNELWNKHNTELENGDMYKDTDRMFYKISEEYYVKPVELKDNSISCTLKYFTCKIKMPAALGRYDVYAREEYTGNIYHLGISDEDGVFNIPENIYEITGRTKVTGTKCLDLFHHMDIFKDHELNRFIDYIFVFKNKKQIQMIRNMLERATGIYGLSIDAMTKVIKVHPYATRRNVLLSDNWCVAYRYS